MPNPNVSHPVASNVMVVNKDGDLELYAIYDAPKQPIWSSRGDLAIGAGVGLKVIGDHQNSTLGNTFSSESVPPTPRRTTKSRDVESRGLIHVLQDDISMVMKRRALAGYGISKV